MAPPALQLAETTVNLIIAYVQANINSALAQVFNDRGDNRVTLESPSDYFIYVPTHAYRRPAVIVQVGRFDFRLPTGPNFINAIARTTVGIVVQDRDRESLTIKTWRYQCALVHLFMNAQLTNTSGSVKLVTKIVSTPFTEDDTVEQKDPSDPTAVFAKGVMIELDVEHYEKVV